MASKSNASLAFFLALNLLFFATVSGGCLVDIEAAVCLCTAIKANVLGINLNVPVSLSLLLNVCGKKVPSGFKKAFNLSYQALGACLKSYKASVVVENKIVDGWDDARFPTVQGIVRRGLKIQALIQIIHEQLDKVKDQFRDKVEDEVEDQVQEFIDVLNLDSKKEIEFIDVLNPDSKKKTAAFGMQI
nr:hypothetical protein [Tanacetum cinerariifolium]